MKVDQRLADISPKWFKTISEAKSMKDILGNRPQDKNNRSYDYDGGPDGKSGNLQNSSTCVVGEAHNESGWYNCSGCDTHSANIGQIARGLADQSGISRKTLLLREVKLFCDHFTTKHKPSINTPKTEEKPTILQDLEIKVPNRT